MWKKKKKKKERKIEREVTSLIMSKTLLLKEKEKKNEKESQKYPQWGPIFTHNPPQAGALRSNMPNSCETKSNEALLNPYKRC